MHNDLGYKRALKIIKEVNKHRPIFWCCLPLPNTNPTVPATNTKKNETVTPGEYIKKQIHVKNVFVSFIY